MKSNKSTILEKIRERAIFQNIGVLIGTIILGAIFLSGLVVFIIIDILRKK